MKIISLFFFRSVGLFICFFPAKLLLWSFSQFELFIRFKWKLQRKSFFMVFMVFTFNCIIELNLIFLILVNTAKPSRSTYFISFFFFVVSSSSETISNVIVNCCLLGVQMTHFSRVKLNYDSIYY